MGSESIIPSPSLPPSPVAPDDDFPGLISPPSLPPSPFSCCAIVSPLPLFWRVCVRAAPSLRETEEEGSLPSVPPPFVRSLERRAALTHFLVSPPPSTAAAAVVAGGDTVVVAAAAAVGRGRPPSVPGRDLGRERERERVVKADRPTDGGRDGPKADGRTDGWTAGGFSPPPPASPIPGSLE